MHLLDTNIIIGILTGREPTLFDRLQLELGKGASVAIPVPVLHELFFGAEKSAHKKRNLERINTFREAVAEIVHFDEGDAAEAAAIRALLERKGTPIGAFDLLIAAQARRRHAVLVTLNRREFARVPGLALTSWKE